jgi:hypothetical protein
MIGKKLLKPGVTQKVLVFLSLEDRYVQRGMETSCSLCPLSQFQVGRKVPFWLGLRDGSPLPATWDPGLKG